MILQPIDFVVYAWLIIAVLSAIYVAYDQSSHNPEAPVMKWGFVLVTLYMGPIGLLLYVMADKEPVPGTHEHFVKPLWKQGVGSTVHCIAGDATGIILAAVATALLGFPMWVDVIVEYVFGFLLGLLIFQSLFMRDMMGGSYGQNVRRSFLPELLSMNMMMAGMAPVMIFMMMGRDMRAMWRAIRLRPILMTTLALIAGMIPVALGIGEGAEFRAPLGRAVIGGVITSTLLTLVVIPTFYEILDEWREWVFRKFGVYKPRTAEHPIPRAARTRASGETLEKLA
jgi:hypothetical protein